MLFWKKDKPKTNSQTETKTQELADLDLENLNQDLPKKEIAADPEIEQYLDHDAKISAQTKAYLQNQQTKVLELDDLESLLSEQQTNESIPTEKEATEQQNYQTVIKEQEEQLKYEFIEPLLTEPIQNPSLVNTAPIVTQTPTWDFEKLIPISEPKINLRIHKTEKRTLPN